LEDEESMNFVNEISLFSEEFNLRLCLDLLKIILHLNIKDISLIEMIIY